MKKELRMLFFLLLCGTTSYGQKSISKVRENTAGTGLEYKVSGGTVYKPAASGTGSATVDTAVIATKQYVNPKINAHTTQIATNATAITNVEPGVLKFATYAAAVAALSGRTKPCRVLITADEVNNSGAFGKYDYDGTTLIEDIL